MAEHAPHRTAATAIKAPPAQGQRPIPGEILKFQHLLTGHHADRLTGLSAFVTRAVGWLIAGLGRRRSFFCVYLRRFLRRRAFRLGFARCACGFLRFGSGRFAGHRATAVGANFGE